MASSSDDDEHYTSQHSTVGPPRPPSVLHSSVIASRRVSSAHPHAHAQPVLTSTSSQGGVHSSASSCARATLNDNVSTNPSYSTAGASASARPRGRGHKIPRGLYIRTCDVKLNAGRYAFEVPPQSVCSDLKTPLECFSLGRREWHWVCQNHEAAYDLMEICPFGH